jgi:hypothetical protein
MSEKTALTAVASEQVPLGFFRIFAQPPGGARREVTIFRDAPIRLTSASTADPFTESVAQIALPQVTVFDNPGSGDLDWLVADADIDIVFANTGAYDFDWRWEGYIASFSMSLTGAESSMSIDLKGAFLGLDDYLAIPSFPRRPIPYEILIARAFDQRLHPSRLGSFRMLFPESWSMRVPEFNDPSYLVALKPYGVSTNQLWTGFTSRSTGSWEPLLTGHVQSMLSVMYTAGGNQWSIRNRGHRRPELYLRTIPKATSDSIIEIYLGAPGVAFDGSRDYTQRAGVIYGSGSDEAGVTYSNMEVTPDGRTSYFKPYAYSARQWPRKGNPMYDKTVKPKETMITFQQGMDELAATKVAQAQYQRFAEPGITGNVTLLTDPRYSDGSLCPRLMIKAGATIRINGLLGVKEGILAHVTSSQVDFQALSVTLTYDTKYRDALTVDEVRARTRDALTPLHALQVGKYANTIQDLIIPWSYKAGSGIIPTPAKEFFQQILPSNATFPYEEWTTKHPPSDPKSAPYYIRIGPTNTENSSKNWSGVIREDKMTMAIPIRMGQAGSIRLTQLAAYDKTGHVMPVKFHFSLYYGNATATDAMPKFPVDPYNSGDPDHPSPEFRRPRKVTGEIIDTNYKVFQANPFYKGAWESVQEDGTTFPWSKDANLPTTGSGIVVGWGNYYEPAGYAPGLASKGVARTGLLDDSTAWTWDVSTTQNIDFQNPDNNVNEEYVGMLFVQIYCDDQDDEPVFFMGRLIRSDPGQTN